jgi:hypothetical protein
MAKLRVRDESTGGVLRGDCVKARMEQESGIVGACLHDTPEHLKHNDIGMAKARRAPECSPGFRSSGRDDRI